MTITFSPFPRVAVFHPRNRPRAQGAVQTKQRNMGYIKLMVIKSSDFGRRPTLSNDPAQRAGQVAAERAAQVAEVSKNHPWNGFLLGQAPAAVGAFLACGASGKRVFREATERGGSGFARFCQC